jgi:hypothetical protein
MPVSVNHRIWGDTGRDLEDKRDVAAIYAARGVNRQREVSKLLENQADRLLDLRPGLA